MGDYKLREYAQLKSLTYRTLWNKFKEGNYLTPTRMNSDISMLRETQTKHKTKPSFTQGFRQTTERHHFLSNKQDLKIMLK